MSERTWEMATIPVELAKELCDAYPILHDLVAFHAVTSSAGVPGYASPNSGPNDLLVRSVVDAGHIHEPPTNATVILSGEFTTQGRRRRRRRRYTFEGSGSGVS